MFLLVQDILDYLMIYISVILPMLYLIILYESRYDL